MTRLILLDRDGVINADSPDYIKDVDEWVPLPGALEAIAALKQSGFLVAVCTNQSGIGRGIVAPAALERIHRRLAERLAELGVRLDGLRYCPHRPEEDCPCRKPRPGMLLESMQALGVGPDETLFVGDDVRDVEAARAAGCRSALVLCGRGRAAEAEARALGVDWVEEDLAAVARRLVAEERC
ncbi:MAG TPA: D-glycero-beta-D-manno-heptose 1,7-bisphosphate 7-phosphatase [Pseudomonadales bacterium]